MKVRRAVDGLVWALAVSVAVDLLLPGEIHLWTRWLVSTVCVVAGGGTVAAGLLRDGRLGFGGGLSGIFLALIGIAGLSTLFNQVNYSRARDMWLMLLTYFILYEVFRSAGAARLRRPLLWLIYGCSVLISLYALHQYFFRWESLEAGARATTGLTPFAASAIQYRLMTRRVFSVFALPTILSDFLALTFPLNVSLLLTTARRPLRIALVALPLVANIWALFLTQSFTGFLSIGFVGAVYYLAGSRAREWLRRRWMLTAGMGLAFLLALGALLYVRKIIFVERIQENPLALRMVNWRIGIQAARDHPVVGVGPDNYQTVYTIYQRGGEQQARHAHSAPIQMFAELGVGGGLLFLALLAGWLRRAWRLLRDPAGEPLAAGLALSFLALWFQNLLDIGIYFPSIGCLSFLITGLMDGAGRRDAAEARRWTIGKRWRLAASAATLVVALVLAFSCRRILLARLDYRSAIERKAMGQRSDAEKLAGRAILRDAETYEPYELLASWQLTDGARNPESMVQARSLYSRALSLSPLTASLHRGMRDACLATGEPLQAFIHARRAAQLFPADGAAATERDRIRAALTAAFETHTK